MAIDTTLTCCNDQQYLSIWLIVIYALLILKLWRVVILHPFKILTVFLHELGHATAAWLTGGRVHGMEVHPNEGGVTETSGGIQWFIVSAGYLGSAAWGMALVIASGYHLASEVAAGVLMFFLLVFIFYAKNWYLRGLNFGFLVFLGGMLVLDIYSSIDPVQYVTLFIGVMSCLFSIYDIWDDLLSRRVNESDASVLAKMTHTSSRCWGAIWGLLAVCSLGVAIFFNLLIAKHSAPSLGSLSEASQSTNIAMYLAIVVFGICVIHTGLTRRCMIRTMSARRAANNAGYADSV